MPAQNIIESELRSTVERMEQRWVHAPPPALAELASAYKEVCQRFEADLGSSARDVALAKSAALMLIQAVANGRATT